MTKNQLKCYHILAAKAFNVHCDQEGIVFQTSKQRAAFYDDWRRKINVDQTGKYSSAKMTNAQFDRVMLELAIVAGDDYWIGRCSTNEVRMLRWIIKKQFICDLEFLEQQKIGWEYIQGICKQAGFSDSLMDCPVEDLERVMMMLDSHIRRLAKNHKPNAIAIADLPSGPFRKGIRPANKAMAIYRHDHHHHITHGAAA